MKKFLRMAAVVAVTLAFGFAQSSCSKDSKDDDEPVVETLTISAGDLLFASAGAEKQYVNIVCSGLWSATCSESWIDLSPKNGNGDGTLTITVNSANETAEVRTATVTVTHGDLSEEINVEQKASLTADCTVRLKNIVRLGDQFAFDVTWGANVAYFQWECIAESDAKRMSDAEIISNLKEQNRIVEQDNYFHAVITVDGENFLSPETNYIVYTLSHDKEGNRGELVKTTVKTRSLRNQPAAYVKDMDWDGNYWRWTTEINPYAARYFSIELTSSDLDDLPLYPDIVGAYFLYTDMQKYPDDYTPAIQTGNWIIVPSYIPYFYVCTWAQDKNDEWSGVTDSDWSSADWYSSRPSFSRTEIKKSVRDLPIENKTYNTSHFHIQRRGRFSPR